MKNHEKLKVRNVELGNSFYMSVYQLKEFNIDIPLYNSTVHWHDHFEIEILDEGSLLHMINCQSYKIKKRDVYLLTPSDIHTISPLPNNESSKISLTNLSFNECAVSEAIFDELMTLRQPVYISLDEKTYEEFHYIIKLIREEGFPGDESSKRIQKHLLSYILLKFIGIYHQQYHDQPTFKADSSMKSKNIDYVNKAIGYIKYNFRNPKLSVKNIAQTVYLSPNYFGEVFYKYMGVTCSEYIKKMKLNFAMGLLMQSDITVSEISEKCGYANISYFISDFKSEFGATPQKYRQQNSKMIPKK